MSLRWPLISSMTNSTQEQISFSRLLKLRMFSAIATLCLLAGCAVRTPEQESRHDDAQYSSALSAFLRDLKPGVSRKEVEDYLHTRNLEFARACCAATILNSYTPNRALMDAYDDWVPLREEWRPWPCGGAYVYIAFEFKGLQPHSSSRRIAADDRDTLEGIHILKMNDCF